MKNPSARRYASWFALIAALPFLEFSGATNAATGISWEPLGLTGNGGMFSPAISPVDPKLMMLNCDMSGAYLTRDGDGTGR